MINKAAFNERNPHTTQQQEPATRSPGGPKKIGQAATNNKAGTIFLHFYTIIYNSPF
jgi:hypothetical protein